MPIEQLCMSAMAVIMLLAALVSTTTFAGPRVPLVRTVNSAPAVAPAEVVECIIQSVNLDEMELVALVDKVKTTFKLSKTVQVTKDRKESELAALAKGDVAVLTLVAGGSDVVKKIEAVSAE